MPSREAPNLLKRLERMTVSSTSSSEPLQNNAPCNLASQKPCCQGKGYTLKSRGMFAQAALCPCVEECSSCKGRMLLVENGLARSCAKPNPKFIAHLFNKAKIPSRYTFAELDDFSNHTGNGRSIIARIRNWEQNFYKDPDKGLVIHGAVGVGKTFILAALARNFLLRGISVRFVDFFQLVTQIRASYTLGQSEQKIIEPLMEADILIIDELGKGRNNDFELTILDQIIMGRYNQNKILIASTNYLLEADKSQGKSSHIIHEPLDQPSSYSPHKRTGEFSQEKFSTLESRIDERIMSRLKETTSFLSLTGGDYRELKGRS